MGLLLRIIVSLLGLAVVAWVLQGIDLAETGGAIQEANLAYLGLGLLLIALSVFIRTLRWRYMLAPRKAIPLASLLGPLVIGYAVGNITATGIGAVPRSLLITRKEGVPTSYVLGTVTLEFIMDAAVVITLAAVASFLVELPPALAPLPYFLLLLAAVIYLIIWAFQRRNSLLFRFLPRSRLAPLASRLPLELRQGWTGFQEGAATFLNRPGILLRIAVLTLCVWVVEALLFWVLMLAAGIEASLPQGSAVMAFTHVVIGIPSLPGFVGTLDAAVLTTLGAVGLERERALSYTLILHAYLIVPLTLVGALMAWREGVALTWRTAAS